jgi:hypothetical protein
LHLVEIKPYYEGMAVKNQYPEVAASEKRWLLVEKGSE